MVRLHAHVKGAWRGEAGGYLRAALVAGVFALLLLVVLTTTGCDSCFISSPSTNFDHLYNMVVKSIIYGIGLSTTASSAQLPGARVTHQLSVSENQAGAPGTADCLYWPPEGATNFVFGDAPANPNGPAPFVFEDLPLGQLIEVSFNLPTLPPGQTSMEAVETFQCDPGVGSPSIAVYTTEIGAGVWDQRRLPRCRFQPTRHFLKFRPRDQ